MSRLYPVRKWGQKVYVLSRTLVASVADPDPDLSGSVFNWPFWIGICIWNTDPDPDPQHCILPYCQWAVRQLELYIKYINKSKVNKIKYLNVNLVQYGNLYSGTVDTVQYGILSNLTSQAKTTFERPFKNICNKQCCGSVFIFYKSGSGLGSWIRIWFRIGIQILVNTMANKNSFFHTCKFENWIKGQIYWMRYL